MNSSAFDVAIKLRPNVDDLKELGPDFSARWKIIERNPDKSIVLMAPCAGYDTPVRARGKTHAFPIDLLAFTKISPLANLSGVVITWSALCCLICTKLQLTRPEVSPRVDRKRSYQFCT